MAEKMEIENEDEPRHEEIPEERSLLSRFFRASPSPPERSLFSRFFRASPPPPSPPFDLDERSLLSRFPPSPPFPPFFSPSFSPSPSERAPKSRDDYLRALSEGDDLVAYVRVMLVGPGGVGKSSFLRGLKNESLPSTPSSTQIADIQSLKAAARAARPTSRSWASYKDEYWREVTDDDEYDEMAQLLFLASQLAPSTSMSFISSAKSDNKKEQFSHPHVRDIVKEVLSRMGDPKFRVSVRESEVWMHIWDCGGQHIFLTILPAFLTARTIFFLMFDARQALNSRSISHSHCAGKTTQQVEEFTTLQLLLQWMSCIHSTLSKDVKSTNVDILSEEESAFNSASEDLTSTSSSSNSTVYEYPQILPIGTHGDDPKVKKYAKSILSAISTECEGKAFAHLLHNGVIVDNTTAGKGEAEDPSYSTVRSIVGDFASNIKVRTPIKWILFRKAFKQLSKNKPVIHMDEIEELVSACYIPKDTIPSVLQFYHDLAVFFHYSDIPSLRSCVIADPQWLINVMAKLLTLEGFEKVGNPTLWAPLRQWGILVKPLYKRIWSEQSFLKPRAILDLMEKFFIIAKIHTRSKKHTFKGQEYFVPSMVKPCPLPLEEIPSPVLSNDAIQAASLYLLFSTNYLPPGFFTQFAAVISREKKCKVIFDEIYRNRISYLYGSIGQRIDQITITRRVDCVEINVIRITSRPSGYPSLLSTCREILNLIEASYTDVISWLPCIDVYLALRCEQCEGVPEHFVVLPSGISSRPEPRLHCQKDRLCILKPHQKFWLDIQQDCMSISDDLIATIASDIHHHPEKLNELAMSLEMTDHLPLDAKTLLIRWQREMKQTNSPLRAHLLHHLKSIGMTRTIYKLEESDHSLKVEQDQCKVQLKECQEMITKLMEENSMLKEENNMLKEENSMLKERLKEEQLHKLMNAHTLASSPSTSSLGVEYQVTGHKVSSKCHSSIGTEKPVQGQKDISYGATPYTSVSFTETPIFSSHLTSSEGVEYQAARHKDIIWKKIPWKSVLMIILVGMIAFLCIKWNPNDLSVQPILEEPLASPSTTLADPRKVKQPKDTYKDVEEVLLKVSGVTYEKMCRDLIIEEKICNKLIGENTLDIQHIAMNYFQQNTSVNWHNLVSILCNQFGHNRLASDVAKEHGVPYEKYCPTT